MKNISNPVVIARTRLGMSQQEFAKLLSVSRNYIWMLEDGRKPITEKILQKIASIQQESEKKDDSPPRNLVLRAVEALERIATALERLQERQVDS